MCEKMYVGIDVSKSWLDVSYGTSEGTILKNIRVENSPKGFERIMKYPQKSGYRFVHVCLESTGIYSESLVSYFHAQQVPISVLNPSQSRAFANSQLLRAKTDQIDAKVLALYAAKIQPRLSTAPDPILVKLKKSVRELRFLITQRAIFQTHLESVTEPELISSSKRLIKMISDEIEVLKKHIISTSSSDLRIGHQVSLLTSIPGLGELTAIQILCELLQDGSQCFTFLGRKCQTAHAGLAPLHIQSGSSIKKKPKICKTANTELRKLLFFPTLSAIRYNPLIKNFFNHLISKGKPKMLAVVACMRKLLMIALGILRNDSPFSARWNSRMIYH